MKKFLIYIALLFFSVSSLYAGVPTVTITDNISDTTTNEDITFTFTFNEGVNDFTSDDIDITHGTKGTFTGENNDTEFTLVVTPEDNFEGDMTVDVDANVTTSDSTDEGNDAADQKIQNIDTKISDANAPDLYSSSDTGKSNSDDLTNDTTPTIQGKNEYGEYIMAYLYEGDTLLGTSSFTSDSNYWYITTDTLSEGEHNLKIKIRDYTGNESGYSDELTITIDTTAPGKPDQSTFDGDDTGESSTDNITNDTTPSFKDTSNYGENVKVTLYNGTSNVGSVTDIADGDDWSISSSSLNNATHSMSITITDDAGNESPKSDTQSITVDTYASIILNVISTDSYVNNEESGSDIVVTGSTYNIEEGQTITLVTGLNDTQRTVDTTASGNFSITIPSGDWDVDDDTYDFNLTVTDIAGNTATYRRTVIVDRNISTPNAPDLSDSSDTGSSNTDDLTNDTTPTFSGNNSYGEIVTVKLYQDGVFKKETTISDGSNWSLTSDNLADGDYTFKITITDTAGNISPDSTGLDITIDTAATVTLDTITSDNYINNAEQDEDLTITGTSTGIEDDQTVTLTFNGNDYDANISNNSYSITVPSDDLNISDRVTNFDISVSDKAGNTRTQSQSVTIDTSSYITITNVAGDNLVSQSEIDAGIIISGTTDFENGRDITIIINGQEYNTTSTGSTFSIDINSSVLSNLDEINYLVSIKAGQTDVAGNEAPSNITVNMTLDKYSDDYQDTELLTPNTTITSSLHELGGDVDLFRLDFNASRGYFTASSSNDETKVSLVHFDGEIIDDNNNTNVSSVLDKGIYYLKIVGEDENTSGEYNVTTTYTAFDLEYDKNVSVKIEEKYSDTNINNITNLSFINQSSKYIQYTSDNTNHYLNVGDESNVTNANFSDDIDTTLLTSRVELVSKDNYNLSISNNYMSLVNSTTNDTKVLNRYQADDFYINNNILYTISSTDGMTMYDITDIQNIKLLGHNATNGISIIANDRYAYVGSATYFKVFLISQDLPDNDVNLPTIEIGKSLDINNYAYEVDVDYFQVILDKSGALKFTSSGVVAGNELNISIDGDAAVDFNNADVSKTLTPGIYTIKISGNNNVADGNYNINVALDTADTKIDKVRGYIKDEVDINITATNTTTSGTLVSDSDVDLYKFELTKSTLIEYSVDNNKTVELIQVDLNTSGIFASEENISKSYLESGIYYLKVSGDEGDYTITTKFTSQSDNNINLVDRYSTVDIGSTISFLTVSQTKGQVNIVDDSGAMKIYNISTGEIIEISPKDAYRISYKSFTTVGNTIEAIYQDGTIWKKQILDISSSLSSPEVVSVVTLTENPNPPKTTIVVNDLTYATTATNGISISNDQGIVSYITYMQGVTNIDEFGEKLYASQGTKLGIVDISSDYSNYKSGASTIYLNRSIEGGLIGDDVDYFRIVLNNTGDFNVTVDNSDVNCTLYKDTNSTPLSCDTATRSAGNYYIKLNSDQDSIVYNFTTYQQFDDHLDTLNFSGDQNLTVVSNNSVSGNIVNSDDIDYFKVVLDARDSLDINITDGFSAELYSEGGSLIDQIDGEYLVNSYGEYYIKVSADTTTSGDYDFTISTNTKDVEIFIDKSDIPNKQMSTIETNGDVVSLKRYGSILYVLDSVDGFMIVDISDIKLPNILSRYETVGTPKDFLISGTYAYIAEGDSGIEILDINNNNINIVSRYNTEGVAYNIAVDNATNKVYVADGTNGLVTLNIANQESPILISSTDTNTTDINITDVAFTNGTLYRSDYVNNSGKNIIATNEYLYISEGSTLKIYDEANTTNALAGYIVDETINSISLIDNFIYASCDNNTYILNIKDSANITLDNTITSKLFDVSNSFDYAFYGRTNQVEIVEISADYSDTFKTAQDVDFDTEVKGQIVRTRATDKDIFKFQTNYTGVLSISSSSMSVDGKVSVYSSSTDAMRAAMVQDKTEDISWSSLTPLKSIDMNDSFDMNLTDLTLNAATFYVVVEDGRDNQIGGNYQFKLDFNTSGDQYIDIINSDTLNFVSIDGGVIEDSLYGTGRDIDFMDINISQRSILTFKQSGDIIPRISIYYPDGTQMTNTVDQNGTQFDIELNSGIYKLKIDGFYEDQNGNYKISIDSKPVDDIVIDNGLSDINIENIVDIKFIGNYIFVLRPDSIAKYTHLLVEKSLEYTSFDTTNENNKFFIYNDLTAQDKFISYISTADNLEMSPNIASMSMDTFIPADIDILTTQTQTKLASDTILPYLKVQHISYNKILYLYDGALTLQIRTMGNTNMTSYPVGNLGKIETISNSDGSDIVYAVDNSAGGNIAILEITLDTDGKPVVSSQSTLTLGAEDISALVVDEKNALLLVGVDQKLKLYDITDRFNPELKKEFDFANEEFAGTPSSIYLKDDKIYVIIPSKGIIMLDNPEDGGLAVINTILNIGKDIDNVFTADHRTVNYTSKENNTTRLKVYFFEDTFGDGESSSIMTGLKDGEEVQEGCFIATAAYGSYFQDHVKVLRDFRDNILLTNGVGKEFVELYYRYSPSIAHSIAQNEFAKMLVRVVLTPIVYMIKYPMYGLMFILFGLLLRMQYLKRKGVVV